MAEVKQVLNANQLNSGEMCLRSELDEHDKVTLHNLKSAIEEVKQTEINLKSGIETEEHLKEIEK